jgi:hypothetical protein
MDDFRMIATVLSMVLGLGVTRLLLALVTIFRIRQRCPPDWLPLLWATFIFVDQLEFWWAINQLPSLRSSFTFVDFVFLVLLTLMLFLSAALLLPSGAEDEQEGLRRYFERDGRFGLLAFTAYSVLGIVANLVFFAAPPAGAWMWVAIVLALMAFVVGVSGNRRLQAWVSLAYIPVLGFDLWLSL